MNNFLGEGRGRRGHRRFPIQQEVRYQCVKGSRIFLVGVGRTLEISSREVRFTTEHPLEPGQKMRLTMDWPALLDDTCRMKLEYLRLDSPECAGRSRRENRALRVPHPRCPLSHGSVGQAAQAARPASAGNAVRSVQECRGYRMRSACA